TVDAGMTLTVANWANTVDYFYSLMDPGAASLGRIAFTGLPGTGGSWQSFDAQIVPVPEPPVYGAGLMLIALALAAWRRKRRSPAAP
ncbi:MAG TPA: hypothetical protein VNL71_21550, partial [Chloroflexota bacterium]|nr:hypothetical protein [Chloroflexota bacterium]